MLVHNAPESELWNNVPRMVLCRKGCPLGPGVVSIDQANVQSTHGTCALPEASEVPGAPGTAGRPWLLATYVELRCLHGQEMTSATKERCGRLPSHDRVHRTFGEGCKGGHSDRENERVPVFLSRLGSDFWKPHPNFSLLAVLIYGNTSIWTQRLTQVSAVQKEPKSGSLSLSLFSRGPRKHRVPWGQPCAVSAAFVLGHCRPLCGLVV